MNFDNSCASIEGTEGGGFDDKLGASFLSSTAALTLRYFFSNSILNLSGATVL